MEHNENEQEMWEQSIFADRGYICLKLAGEGAFSRVYCLENKMDGRRYACKVSSKIGLLEEEEHIMSKLQHPLFPECFEVWREAEKEFLLMEYIPGSTVEEMLRRRKCFQVQQALRMGMELADGLRMLHENPEAFVFRDIKPANIMVRQDGRIKLIDFGCACVSGKEAVSQAGTPGFAAPEQMQGGGILTAVCDVYGWGQTMKAILGMTEKIALKSWIGQERNRRKMRKQLWYVLDACTQQEPSNRIPDMRGVMAALTPLMLLCEDNEDKRKNRKYYYFPKGIICKKNIIIIQS